MSFTGFGIIQGSNVSESAATLLLFLEDVISSKLSLYDLVAPEISSIPSKGTRSIIHLLEGV
jgi:hypothetical protein